MMQQDTVFHPTADHIDPISANQTPIPGIGLVLPEHDVNMMSVESEACVTPPNWRKKIDAANCSTDSIRVEEILDSPQFNKSNSPRHGRGSTIKHLGSAQLLRSSVITSRSGNLASVITGAAGVASIVLGEQPSGLEEPVKTEVAPIVQNTLDLAKNNFNNEDFYKELKKKKGKVDKLDGSANLLTLLDLDQLQIFRSDIQVIALDNNKLQQVQGAGLFLSLTTLTLKQNKLTTVDFKQLLKCSFPALKHLDLSSNLISEVPADIQILQSLNSLNLKDNQIAALPKEITYLSKLTLFTLEWFEFSETVFKRQSRQYKDSQHCSAITRCDTSFLVLLTLLQQHPSISFTNLIAMSSDPLKIKHKMVQLVNNHNFGFHGSFIHQLATTKHTHLLNQVLDSLFNDNSSDGQAATQDNDLTLTLAFNAKNNFGQTPLQVCFDYNNFDMAMAFLNHIQLRQILEVDFKQRVAGRLQTEGFESDEESKKEIKSNQHILTTAILNQQFDLASKVLDFMFLTFTRKHKRLSKPFLKMEKANSAPNQSQSEWSKKTSRSEGLTSVRSQIRYNLNSSDSDGFTFLHHLMANFTPKQDKLPPQSFIASTEQPSPTAATSISQFYKKHKTAQLFMKMIQQTSLQHKYETAPLQLNQLNSYDETPLDLAIDHSQHQAVEFMLYFNQCQLHNSEYMKSKTELQLFNVNGKDNNRGFSPLHKAAFSNNYQALLLLLQTTEAPQKPLSFKQVYNSLVDDYKPNLEKYKSLAVVDPLARDRNQKLARYYSTKMVFICKLIRLCETNQVLKSIQRQSDDSKKKKDQIVVKPFTRKGCFLNEAVIKTTTFRLDEVKPIYQSAINSYWLQHQPQTKKSRGSEFTKSRQLLHLSSLDVRQPANKMNHSFRSVDHRRFKESASGVKLAKSMAFNSISTRVENTTKSMLKNFGKHLLTSQSATRNNLDKNTSVGSDHSKLKLTEHQANGFLTQRSETQKDNFKLLGKSNYFQTTMQSARQHQPKPTQQPQLCVPESPVQSETKLPMPFNKQNQACDHHSTSSSQEMEIGVGEPKVRFSGKQIKTLNRDNSYKGMQSTSQAVSPKQPVAKAFTFKPLLHGAVVQTKPIDSFATSPKAQIDMTQPMVRSKSMYGSRPKLDQDPAASIMSSLGYTKHKAGMAPPSDSHSVNKPANLFSDSEKCKKEAVALKVEDLDHTPTKKKGDLSYGEADCLSILTSSDSSGDLLQMSGVNTSQKGGCVTGFSSLPMIQNEYSLQLKSLTQYKQPYYDALQKNLFKNDFQLLIKEKDFQNGKQVKVLTPYEKIKKLYDILAQVDSSSPLKLQHAKDIFDYLLYEIDSQSTVNTHQPDSLTSSLVENKKTNDSLLYLKQEVRYIRQQLDLISKQLVQVPIFTSTVDNQLKVSIVQNEQEAVQPASLNDFDEYVQTPSIHEDNIMNSCELDLNTTQKRKASYQSHFTDSDQCDIEEDVITTPLKTRSKVMIPQHNLIPSEMLQRPQSKPLSRDHLIGHLSPKMKLGEAQLQTQILRENQESSQAFNHKIYKVKLKTSPRLKEQPKRLSPTPLVSQAVAAKELQASKNLKDSGLSVRRVKAPQLIDLSKSHKVEQRNDVQDKSLDHQRDSFKNHKEILVKNCQIDLTRLNVSQEASQIPPGNYKELEKQLRKKVFKLNRVKSDPNQLKTQQEKYIKIRKKASQSPVPKSQTTLNLSKANKSLKLSQNRSQSTRGNLVKKSGKTYTVKLLQSQREKPLGTQLPKKVSTRPVKPVKKLFDNPQAAEVSGDLQQRLSEQPEGRNTVNEYYTGTPLTTQENKHDNSRSEPTSNKLKKKSSSNQKFVIAYPGKNNKNSSFSLNLKQINSSIVSAKTSRKPPVGQLKKPSQQAIRLSEPHITSQNSKHQQFKKQSVKLIAKSSMNVPHQAAPVQKITKKWSTGTQGSSPQKQAVKHSYKTSIGSLNSKMNTSTLNMTNKSIAQLNQSHNSSSTYFKMTSTNPVKSKQNPTFAKLKKQKSSQLPLKMFSQSEVGTKETVKTSAKKDKGKFLLKQSQSPRVFVNTGFATHRPQAQHPNPMHSPSVNGPSPGLSPPFDSKKKHTRINSNTSNVGVKKIDKLLMQSSNGLFKLSQLPKPNKDLSLTKTSNALQTSQESQHISQASIYVGLDKKQKMSVAAGALLYNKILKAQRNKIY